MRIGLQAVRVSISAASLSGLVCVLLSGCSPAEISSVIGRDVKVTDENKHDLDFLFRLVADGDAEQFKSATKALYQHGLSGSDPWLIEYSMGAQRSSNGPTPLKPNKNNAAVLLRAIPRLIESMPDEQIDNPAWWILISIQPYCPAPKKEIWQKWWKGLGVNQFEAIAKGP